MSFGRDFEQQLSFCVEARAAFCNLEPVLVQLVHVSVSQVVLGVFRLGSPCVLCFCLSDGEHAGHGDQEGDAGESLPQNRRLCQSEQNSGAAAVL